MRIQTCLIAVLLSLGLMACGGDAAAPHGANAADPETKSSNPDVPAPLPVQTMASDGEPVPVSGAGVHPPIPEQLPMTEGSGPVPKTPGVVPPVPQPAAHEKSASPEN